MLFGRKFGPLGSEHNTRWKGHGFESDMLKSLSENYLFKTRIIAIRNQWCWSWLYDVDKYVTKYKINPNLNWDFDVCQFLIWGSIMKIITFKNVFLKISIFGFSLWH